MSFFFKICACLFIYAGINFQAWSAELVKSILDFDDCTPRVSIIGLGKLGSPMASLYALRGFDVTGVDKNLDFVAKINAKLAPVQEPGLQEILSNPSISLQATTDTVDAVKNTDVSFIIVPTPSTDTGAFTNKYILSALKEIGEGIAKKSGYHLVVVTSTVMPGSTGGDIKEALESYSGRLLGDNLGLCYNPEFIALGSVIENMTNPDFILIGESDETAGDFLEKIYNKFCPYNPPIRRMNFVNAELTKISVNTYLTMKISFANMLGEICGNIPGGDVDVVSKAVGSDTRIGSKFLKSGIGYGGPCLPRDTVAFNFVAQEASVTPHLVLATEAVNKSQNQRIIDFVKRSSKKDSAVGILGLSYKPNTPVIEESQGISLAMQLFADEMQVVVYDPAAMEASKVILGETVSYAKSVDDCIDKSDCLVIMTPWEEFKSINPDCFERKSEFSVIDCWRILPELFSPKAIIIHPGKSDY